MIIPKKKKEKEKKIVEYRDISYVFHSDIFVTKNKFTVYGLGLRFSNTRYGLLYPFPSGVCFCISKIRLNEPTIDSIGQP